MDMCILPGCLSGAVRAIPAKSQAHRALICAALADGPTRIECAGESADIAATAACLTALGAKIKREPGGYLVHPLENNWANTNHPPETPTPVGVGARFIAANKHEPATLPCGESGSTFRFLLPVVCALGQSASFLPQGRLPQRPLSPLYEELIRHGCNLSPPGAVPFQVTGQLIPGRYELDAGVSSQFISGLLFALPLLGEDSELHLSGQVESYPYIELTIAMLEVFGIQLEFDGAVFAISGNQVFRSPGELNVEGDWSNAAFWLGAGAIGTGIVTCTNLNLASRQGDRAFVDILKRFGARVEAGGSSVTVSGGQLRGIEIDARDIPDLAPIAAVNAAAAVGITVIRNAGRLRTKESDRLAATSAMLRSLGVDISETDDGLLIKGGAALKGGAVSSYGDHRIAMAAAIAATVCAGPVVIQGAEAVNKSYPGFFDDLRLLGGSAQIIRT